MSGGASTSHMVFFITSLVVATSVAGVLLHSVYSISSGIRSREQTLTDQLKTDIEILNDPNSMPNNPVLIYVKNIGSTTLDQNRTDILLDGQLRDSADITLVNSTGYWAPLEVIEISINTTLASGDHYVKVVTENGVEDSMNFRI